MKFINFFTAAVYFSLLKQTEFIFAVHMHLFAGVLPILRQFGNRVCRGLRPHRLIKAAGIVGVEIVALLGSLNNLYDALQGEIKRFY